MRSRTHNPPYLACYFHCLHKIHKLRNEEYPPPKKTIFMHYIFKPSVAGISFNKPRLVKGHSAFRGESAFRSAINVNQIHLKASRITQLPNNYTCNYIREPNYMYIYEAYTEFFYIKQQQYSGCTSS